MDMDQALGRAADSDKSPRSELDHVRLRSHDRVMFAAASTIDMTQLVITLRKGVRVRSRL
jgi:hypothetical protein